MAPKKEEQAKVPIVPEWCDCYSYTYPQKLIFIGVTRGILALISLGLCIAFLVVYKPTTGVRVVLGMIICINVIHILVTVYFTCTARFGNPKKIKRWFYSDLVLAGIFIILVIVLLCTIPGTTVNILLGVKLICLSGLLCYQNTVYYTNMPNQSSRM